MRGRSWRRSPEALAPAHAHGVLHLDLKTQNIFVLRDGWVKVLDFGLAGLDWTEDIPGRLVRVAGGTPGTMAPEQVERAPTDARTDLWAVGVILYRLLFGQLPEAGAWSRRCLSAESQAVRECWLALFAAIGRASLMRRRYWPRWRAEGSTPKSAAGGRTSHQSNPQVIGHIGVVGMAAGLGRQGRSGSGTRVAPPR